MSATDRDRGLYQKYQVERADGRPVIWCFVLEQSDPLALPALTAYAAAAREAGNAQLADDLDGVVAAQVGRRRENKRYGDPL